MTTIKNFITKYKYFLVCALVLVLVGAYFTVGKGKSVDTGYTVKKVDVEQSVILSGKVQTTDRADLGFAASGRLGKISVKNNQQVKQGAVLAQLEIADLSADLKIKELNSSTSSVNLQAAKDNLDKVTSRENTKVANAYRTLLSTDLKLTPDSSGYTLSAPTVSGIYNGTEGQYKVLINKENITFPDFWVRTFGLETTSQMVSKEAPTVLGTKGLYISLENTNLGPYYDTMWLLDIPNKSSSSYLANYNAYNEARDARDVAIKEAQSKYNALLSGEGTSGNSIAQAEIEKIKAEIAKNTIYAPFDGRVTNIEKEVGENASVGERVISILGENKLEVVLQVSELDVSKLVIGSSIKLTFDAFPGETFDGTLATVNSRDTTVEGVPVYEAFVELTSDPRIKTGMSANGVIILANKHDVVAIPSYLITKDATGSSVLVRISDDKTQKHDVVTGITGTDSMVEILSGLQAGDIVIDTTKK